MIVTRHLTVMCVAVATLAGVAAVIVPTLAAQHTKASQAGMNPQRLARIPVRIFLIQQHLFRSEAPNSMRETFMAMTYTAIVQ